MKKKYLTIGALAFALAVAGYGVKSNMSSGTQLSDLAKANVEALAQDEDEDSWIAGFEVGFIIFSNGKTLDCCVPSNSNNACNVGSVGCIHFI